MATNLYFNHFPKNITSEQLLVEDLVIEALKIYGMEVYYIPRESRDEIDLLYGENRNKEFKNAFVMEMYLEDVTGMEGEQDFISKFGLEIRDEIRFLVSRRRFKYVVSNIDRPREGDLIYVPLVQNFFEITFVEHENDQAMFYTLGRGRGGNVYVYALKLKQFVFSEEKIETGVEEIQEQIRDEYRRTIINLKTGGSGKYILDEIVYQGTDIANATFKAVVHSYRESKNTELIVTQTYKTPSLNVNIKGATSNANWQVSSYDQIKDYDNAFEDVVDNNRIETEADSIIDFSETNPFGEP